MKRPSKYNIASILFAAVFIFYFLLYLGIVPKYADVCYTSANSNQENCAPHNIIEVFILVGARVINDNNGVITAFATIAIAYFTRTLWKTSDSQLKELSRSINAAENGTRLQLRAWVFIRVSNATLDFPTDRFFAVNHHIFNKGLTPGKITNCSFNIDVLANPLPNDFILRYGEISIQDAIIGPQQSFDAGQWNSTSIFTPEIMSDIRSNRQRVYFFGKFTYTDVFSQLCTTEFCFSLIADSIRQIAPGQFNGTWEPVPGRNEFT
jgi:hypothetical protein